MEKCFYECGRNATTNDHIIPVAQGGADHHLNYVRACRFCNGDRDTLPIAEFLAQRGVSKPVPEGITSLVYHLTQIPIEQLTIITCEHCKQTVVARKTRANNRLFCSERHGKRYAAKRKRDRIRLERQALGDNR